MRPADISVSKWRWSSVSAARIADWPFAVKMGLLPGICVVTLVASMTIAASALDQQAKLIDTVVQQDMAVAVRLSTSATRLQQIDAGLYRTLALQAAHVAGRPVGDEMAPLQASVADVQNGLKAYRRSVVKADVVDKLEHLISELDTYRGALEVVGSMLEIDFPSAVAFISPFDVHTRTTLAALSVLVEDAVKSASARAVLSARVAAATRAGFALVAGLLAMIVTVFAVVVTRATVRSVEEVAAATVLVAGGDRFVSIRRLARRDELGAIVESLQSFQDNVSRVAFLAHHDALTELPNRVLFADRLESALADLANGGSFALLCLDLDRFKAVNDTLGHLIGDKLLCEVASRVTACVRERDTVARLGGDEFAVVALRIAGEQDAGDMAERIVRRLNEPFDLDGHIISIGCSIGISIAPKNGTVAERLLQGADTALYRAKTEGRNMHRFFDVSMDMQLKLRRELEVDMRRAILAGEFELHYQPLVTIKTMQISGFEALMRWRHPELGMISPADFIAVAEETGLIVRLGQIALSHACRDAMTWPAPVRVSVNLSPVQFTDPELLQTILQALESSGLAPNRLELEITESVLLHHSEATIGVLRELRANGVRLSMDDFGTGYSSLSYLSNFKFDKIKIDQSFVRNLCESESSAAIVRAVTGLSGSLGVITTAEGVETEEQFARLAAEGCTEVQGYLFGRPRPVADVPFALMKFGYALAIPPTTEAGVG